VDGENGVATIVRARKLKLELQALQLLGERRRLAR
jgi:hypothetical protein